jgi:hypothetical protein
LSVIIAFSSALPEDAREGHALSDLATAQIRSFQGAEKCMIGTDENENTDESQKLPEGLRHAGLWNNRGGGLPPCCRSGR